MLNNYYNLKKTFPTTLNSQLLNSSRSDRFGWRCHLMNQPIYNNQNSIIHVATAAIDDIWWWKYNKTGKGVEHWTWCCSTVPGEAMGGLLRRDEWMGRRHLRGPWSMSMPRGNLTYFPSRSFLPRSIGKYCFCRRFSPPSAVFTSIVFSCFLFSPPFEMNAAQCFGSARIRDVPHVIRFVVFFGLLLSLCRRVRVQEPPPSDWGMLNIYVHSWETPQQWRVRTPKTTPNLGGGGGSWKLR